MPYAMLCLQPTDPTVPKLRLIGFQLVSYYLALHRNDAHSLVPYLGNNHLKV